jgi:TPR repeat protein
MPNFQRQGRNILRKNFLTISGLVIATMIATDKLECMQAPSLQRDSVDELRRLAESGDTDAQYDLSTRMWYGSRGEQKDRVESIRWLIRAAKRGHETAGDMWQLMLGGVDQLEGEGQYALYQVFFNGIEVPRDEDKGIIYLLKAGLKGYQAAQTELSMLSETDDSNLQYRLGRILLCGIGGIESNFDQGTCYLSLAAYSGHVGAQMLLADAFCNGKYGAAKDINTGAAYLEMAADAGNAEAQFLWGRMLCDGALGALDRRKGRNYLMQAAYQGNADVQTLLWQTFKIIYAPNTNVWLSDIRYAPTAISCSGLWTLTEDKGRQDSLDMLLETLDPDEMCDERPYVELLIAQEIVDRQLQGRLASHIIEKIGLSNDQGLRCFQEVTAEMLKSDMPDVRAKAPFFYDAVNQYAQYAINSENPADLMHFDASSDKVVNTGICSALACARGIDFVVLEGRIGRSIGEVLYAFHHPMKAQQTRYAVQLTDRMYGLQVYGNDSSSGKIEGFDHLPGLEPIYVTELSVTLNREEVVGNGNCGWYAIDPNYNMETNRTQSRSWATNLLLENMYDETVRRLIVPEILDRIERGDFEQDGSFWASLENEAKTKFEELFEKASSLRQRLSDGANTAQARQIVRRIVGALQDEALVTIDPDLEARVITIVGSLNVDRVPENAIRITDEVMSILHTEHVTAIEAELIDNGDFVAEYVRLIQSLPLGSLASWLQITPPHRGVMKTNVCDAVAYLLGANLFVIEGRPGRPAGTILHEYTHPHPTKAPIYVIQSTNIHYVKGFPS